MSRKKNFNFYEGFTFFVPGPKGIIQLLLWFILGVLAGSVVTSLVSLFAGYDASLKYGTLVSYPLMFIPAMMYASLCSKKNSFFDGGTALDSSHFGRTGGWLCAAVVMVATFAMSFITDALSELLPEMPEELEKVMESMTQGDFWVNFLCVSVFAPFFEEWLCRGEVLRGLLNYRKKDGGVGMKPLWAIIISALFFAVIHGNPWQALPAFGAGCLLGYVYYRTGSLKLTMLMHFTNNTLALLLSRLPAFEEAETWSEVLAPAGYWVIMASCAIILVLSLRFFARIELKDRQGNCDAVNVDV